MTWFMMCGTFIFLINKMLIYTIKKFVALSVCLCLSVPSFLRQLCQYGAESLGSASSAVADFSPCNVWQRLVNKNVMNV